MIKVLFFVRPDLYRIKAGDTYQILNLKDKLKNQGVMIDINPGMRPDHKSYDLVHCFNILRTDSTLAQCRWTKKMGYPLILTPIYWNMREFIEQEKPEALGKWNTAQQKRQEILELVDLLAPNGEGEWLQLKRDFKLSIPYRIIYNGVDPYFCCSRDGPRVGIISVGRIHKRKNQLQIIRALKDVEIPITFIGDINDRAYHKACQQFADNNVSFTGGVGKTLLKEYYCKARVHLLASWYDTPGLVNLEAGLAGCNLVTTDRGTTREYLQEFALYCNPTDPLDIREKVLRAYRLPVQKKLVYHLQENYTWQKIATKVIKIYTELLTGLI